MTIKKIVFLFLYIHQVQAWNTDELEVFDAVEEVKQNFYTLLDVHPVNTILFKRYKKYSVKLLIFLFV